MTRPGPSSLLYAAAALALLGLIGCEARPAAMVPGADAGSTGDGSADGAGDPLERYRGGALLLPSFKAQHAAFSPALTRVALVRDNAGYPAELKLFDLRGATSSTVAKDAIAVEWLDEGRLLYTARKLGPATDRYRLELVELASGSSTPLGEVCWHVLAADRRSVLATRGDCLASPALAVRGVASAQPGPWRTIAKAVAGRAQFSPDSRRVAFHTGSASCIAAAASASLQLHDLTDGKTTVVHAGAAEWPRFIGDGRLLYSACDKGGDHKLMVHSALTGASMELATKMTQLFEYGLAECAVRYRYHVTKDARYLLGGSGATLYRIATDGKGPVSLASGLAGGSEWYKGFGLSHDGAYAVYLGQQGKGHTLSSVPLAGGASRLLFSDPLRSSVGFELSPAAAEVAFLRRLDGSRVQILRAELGSGGATPGPLHTATSIEDNGFRDSPPRFLPDGRGLLWFGLPERQLLYIPRAGGVPTLLGRVEQPWLGCRGSLVDASGELALFNSPGGVRLARLPR
jgi:hypothetical protein